MFSLEPINLGRFDLPAPEYMYIQYMPIKWPNGDFMLPRNLDWCSVLLSVVFRDYGNADLWKNANEAWQESYVYITAKHMWVEAGTTGNRAGWHIDGYLTDDVSYVWCDKNPTEFCVQVFDLSPDHDISLREMQEQAKEYNITTYPANTLLKLDNTMVHRAGIAKESGYRTFVKISISKEQYRLKGNAKNPLVYYDWEMLDRNPTRNCPQMKEK